MTVNRQFLLRKRPVGLPARDDFELVQSAMPEPADGEILIRNRFASIDPAIRGWMDDAPSYWPPIALGDPVRTTNVSEVVASNHPDYKAGDWVIAVTGLENYSCLAPDDFTNLIDVGMVPSPTAYLYVLGAVGLTAYFATVEEARPAPGETMLVTGAAGAVGSLVGQIGKINGCRTIGIAGGPQKCERLIRDYGYDVAIDYRGKTTEQLAEEIRAAAPEGVNIIFENVGGIILDAGLLNLAPEGRAIICGLISEYNSEVRHGTRQVWQLIVTGGTMQGFLLTRYVDRFEEGRTVMAHWIGEGLIHYDEHIDVGLDGAYDTLMKLFSGANEGKMILQFDA